MKKDKKLLHSKLILRLITWGVFITTLSFLGCEGLDFSNPNSPDLTSASIQALVTGAEADMRTDLDVYIQVTITIGREGYFFEPADPRFTGELLFGPVDPGGFLTLRPWSARYRVVFNCNELLNRAENLSGTAKAGVEGFAKTIRAYQLLLNLNYLDENGIRLNFDGDITKPFATKDEAFDFIEKDLNEANTALASAGNSVPFQLSSGFAGFDTPSGFAKFNRALMARVLVF
ncbi:MAG: RagB/SusD family nutrient uptake outer membrane protein, partial [bacterium]